VVLDLVGGDYLPASIEAMAVKGRLVSIGTVAGNRAEISLGQIMSKRLQIIGTALRSRSIEEKIAVTEAFAAKVVPALGDGRLRPVIDSEFPMREVQAAHRKLESGDTFGKVVLVLD
jgi:NADPH:quinone reductase-like Zn-dependent oxidoreductase